EAAIDALRDGLAAQEARTSEAAEAARAEVARMQAEAEAARQATEAEADGALRQAALGQIGAALLSGAPYADPLATLEAAGHEIAPVLADHAESGLPTLAGLTERFDEPARAAIAAELRDDMGETLTDRIGSFLRAQTGARSLAPREGTDADAVLSRAEAALRAGDIDRALVELAALSDPARTEMAAWIVQAERHRDAASALATLSAAVRER
ncbi:MAG: COG4223 family protein, partial [Pseudorhodobacter sp.]